MSADVIGKAMPPHVGLDELAEMNAADTYGHRYETSPAGGRHSDSGEDGDGGRQPRSVWLPITDLLLVIEIVSVGSRSTDKDTKRHEYAAAGIPQYWVVDRDNALTVTLHRLGPDYAYVERAKMPLAWLLRTEPSEHLG